jgi:hypothetical protein
MAVQRRINFAGAMHEMRSSRVHIPQPLRTPDGGFDRQAIMKEACRQARRFRAGMSWQQRVGMCLRSVWQSAKLTGSRPYSPPQITRRWPASRLLAAGVRP